MSLPEMSWRMTLSSKFHIHLYVLKSTNLKWTVVHSLHVLISAVGYVTRLEEMNKIKARFPAYVELSIVGNLLVKKTGDQYSIQQTMITFLIQIAESSIYMPSSPMSDFIYQVGHVNHSWQPIMDTYEIFLFSLLNNLRFLSLLPFYLLQQITCNFHKHGYLFFF